MNNKLLGVLFGFMGTMVLCANVIAEALVEAGDRIGDNNYCSIVK